MLFLQVCKNLGFTCETEYFGLVECHKENNNGMNSNQIRHHDWINLRNPLGQHGTTGQPCSLSFRVKFWVPAHLILQDSVRNIFYMQARIDLLEGRLRATDWDNAAKLGALLAQGDEIKFDSNALTCNIHCSTDASLSTESSGNEDCNGGGAATSESLNIGCASGIIGGGCKDTISKSKKRKLSKQRSTLDDDDEPETNQIIVQEYSPLRIYEDYVINVEDDVTDEMPIEFARRIAIEHGKLTKMSSKSAKYWLLESIFKLPGFGEETFSGIIVSSTQSTAIAALTNSPSTFSQHHDSTAQRCDISVGPHGLLITMPDEQTR